MSQIKSLEEDGSSLHLKGTELVADGCTKPLQGQAFTQFVDDLGLRRIRREHRSVPENRPTAGGEHHGAAMRALVVGGTLLSMAEAYDEEPEAEGDLTWGLGDGSRPYGYGAQSMLGSCFIAHRSFACDDCECRRRVEVLDRSREEKMSALRKRNVVFQLALHHRRRDHARACMVVLLQVLHHQH